MSFRDMVPTLYGGVRGSLEFPIGATNGTTAVEIVPAPGANEKSILLWVSVINTDTAAADVYFEYDDNSSPVNIGGFQLAVDDGDEWPKYGVYEVSGAANSINIVLKAAHTSAALRWAAAYLKIEG